MKLRIEEFYSELNAFEIYSLFKDKKNTILLDSSKEDKRLSNYSFIGLNPYMTFKSIDKEIYIDKRKFTGDPFLELEKLINSIEVEDLEKGSFGPFISGCIGYFSYDIGRTIEYIEELSSSDFNCYDSYFVFYDNILIFDLINNKKYITALGKTQESKASIEAIKERISSGEKISEDFKGEIKNKFNSNFIMEEYINSVAKVKKYIKSGDVYIANLTQRFWCENLRDGYEIYKDLRCINKAPFAAYLNLEDIQIICSSPERFLKLEDRCVETRPIKGTRPRGKDAEEDEKNKLELINSEKDKAELLMIVDLERNDLSKVCKPHSVKVTELFKLEEYATVFHLVSTIKGTLKDDVSAVKLMRECFPGGSITGAPKIRAMEIIEELERIKRNIYTGAIGYFDIRGNCDFNIVIRTIVKKDNKAFFGVGGGITIESEEEMEYYETIDKAKALMRVL